MRVSVCLTFVSEFTISTEPPSVKDVSLAKKPNAGPPPPDMAVKVTLSNSAEAPAESTQPSNKNAAAMPTVGSILK